ncbi:hypothetical protein [Hydrocarboniphaga sp.]|uniref:hypothetical protein n=1 Tax=Hydrocarboniphaga sp. TaxID=2033016 RepID=UPI003D11BADA
MSTAFMPSLADGSIQIHGSALKLGAGVSRVAAVAALGRHYSGNRELKDGGEWVYLQGLSFDGADSGMSLYFEHGALLEVNWSVILPDAELDGGWPSQEAIDQEIAFVRAALGKLKKRGSFSGRERYAWGEVWCEFDAQAFSASSGLRYRTRPS